MARIPTWEYKCPHCKQTKKYIMLKRDNALSAFEMHVKHCPSAPKSDKEKEL